MNPLRFLHKLLLGPERYKWEKEYAAGRWDYLHKPGQAERYKAVLDFVSRYLRGNRAILEIGCGEGILQSRMPPGMYSRFLGIDLSHVAIRKAARFKDSITEYRTGDMETYIPPGKYAMIIFNEVLNYSTDPLRTVQRYLPYLEADGLLLFSLNETPWALEIIGSLEKAFPLVDEKRTIKERGAWHCKLYTKPRPDAPFPYAL
jgi:2-polyprenyl-3-methyl-5-hydroxy-6-metoxy-1,4-benzoquinol methylase